MLIIDYLIENKMSAGGLVNLIEERTGYKVSRTTLTRIMRGDVRDPSVNLAIAIEQATDGDVRVWEVAPPNIDALSH